MRKSYTKKRSVAKPDHAELRLMIKVVCPGKIGELCRPCSRPKSTSPETRTLRAAFPDPEQKGRATATGTIVRGLNVEPWADRRPGAREPAGRPSPRRFLPSHKRRLREVDASLTDLWLAGLATRDFEGTLRAFLGQDAPLSAATITRVNKQHADEFDPWKTRRLDDVDLIFAWVDGVYLGAGPDYEPRVFLAVMGADHAGQKHLIALQEAMSESAGAWEELLSISKTVALELLT